MEATLSKLRDGGCCCQDMNELCLYEMAIMFTCPLHGSVMIDKRHVVVAQPERRVTFQDARTNFAGVEFPLPPLPKG
jgi:ABC-type taurine transport system ATPase subunit